MPSDRVLAETLGVSPRTINRHLIRFVEKGIITRTPGRGTFRTGGPDDPPAVHIPLSAPDELAAHFRRSIALGDLKSGEALPSIKRTSLQFKVSYRTAIDAYRILQEEHLVFKTGKTFWIGTLKEHIHPSRDRQVFLFNFRNSDFTQLYRADIMGRMFRKMEMELQSSGFLVRYGNTDDLPGLAASWRKNRSAPAAMVFCEFSEDKYTELRQSLSRMKRLLGPDMPPLLLDWHQGRYDGKLPDTQVMTRGNILTSSARTLAAFLQRNKFRKAALFMTESGFTWSFPAASLVPFRCLWETHERDAGFDMQCVIKPAKTTFGHIRYLHGRRLERQIRTHALQVKYQPTDADVRAIHRALRLTDDITGVLKHYTDMPVWIFDRDTDAAAAMEWAAGQGIRIPEDISVITLQNDPRYFHLGLTYCGPDWETIGYQMAHAVIRDVPVMKTGKGFIRTRAVVIEKLTTK